MLGLAHGNADWIARVNAFEVIVRVGWGGVGWSGVGLGEVRWRRYCLTYSFVAVYLTRSYHGITYSPRAETLVEKKIQVYRPQKVDADIHLVAVTRFQK